MKGGNFKYVYALLLLTITIAWTVFAVFITYKAMTTPTPVNVLGTAGVDTFLGALLSWNSLIIQHYFRKGIPEDNVEKPPTA